MRPFEEWTVVAAWAAVAVAAGAWALTRRKISPAERERERRLALGRRGRMIDAVVIDVDGSFITYSYSFRGVDYQCAQDISALRDRLPQNLDSVVGPATIKFMPDNPFNSILVGEEWNGLLRSNISRPQGG